MKKKQECVERDYTTGAEAGDGQITPEEEAMVRKALKRMEHIDAQPHLVDPFAARRFNEMVKACDLMAKEFSGKLKATVDYEYYAAQIELECLYVDFDQGEFMGTLSQLAMTANSIRFQPLTSGLLRVVITMPYFLV